MLFNNPKSTVKLILVGLALIIGAVIYSTKAESAELDLGYGRTILRGPTDIAAVTVVYPKQIGDIDLYTGVLLIGTYDFRDVPQANQVVVRSGFTAHIKQFGASLGVAKIQHEDDLNSGAINFNLGLSYRWRRLVVSYNHLSNAGTERPNIGRDMVILSWRFGERT